MRKLATTAVLMNCAAILLTACGGTDSNTSLPSGNAGGNASVTTGVGGNSQPNGGRSSAGGTATTAASSLGGASGGGTQHTGGRSDTSAPTGGALATGGVSPTTGGAAPSGGSAATGGSRATGGTTASTNSTAGGTNTTGGTSAASGGTKATGGASAATGGSKTTGGTSATGGTAAGGSSGSCGTLNPNPFGCKFAWGVSDKAYDFLQFATTWIETGMNADGTYNSCGGCNWIKNTIAPTNLIPVYYAYIIGFLGHANGYVDGNQCPASNPNCPNLTTDGADLIRSKRTQIVNAYANYAKQSYAVWPTKPLVWLFEGDFVQYAGSSQKNPLTMTELGQLAADITCAIKGNMPNAVVAMDHSTWNPDQTTKDFFNAIKIANYDMVWTTGVANNNGYIYSGANSTSYNAATAKYSVLRQLTGKTIMVDDGCGANLDEDWKKATPTLLNGLIANGVIAFGHCGSLESTYQSSITALEPQLNSTCL